MLPKEPSSLLRWPKLWASRDSALQTFITEPWPKGSANNWVYSLKHHFSFWLLSIGQKANGIGLCASKLPKPLKSLAGLAARNVERNSAMDFRRHREADPWPRYFSPTAPSSWKIASWPRGRQRSPRY